MEPGILSALYRDVQFDYSDYALDEVLVDIRFNFGIPILVDTRAMTKAGVSTNTLVTAKLRDVPLFIAMIELLAPLELTCVYRHQVLWITTPSSTLLDDDKVTRVVSDGRSPRIDRALASPAQWDYFNQPLHIVLGDIAFNHSIIIKTDLANPNELVTLALREKSISVRSGLGILCHSYDLRCIEQDDKLLVTDARPMD
jgi:hypothetical protein